QWRDRDEATELSPERLLQACESACYGEKSLKALESKDLTYHFESVFDAGLVREFQKELPMKIQVPSGSWITLSYPEGQPPYLEVRLQELFGLRELPKLNHGKIPITVHLLGPNYRPVQVTSDLPSFWKNGYPEVRKELRSRYPKHSWPEDPLTAK